MNKYYGMVGMDGIPPASFTGNQVVPQETAPQIHPTLNPALHPISSGIATRMTSEWPAWFVYALQCYRLPVERNVVVPDVLQQVLEIRAAQLIQLPLRYMSISEQCGRVYVVNVVPVDGSYEPEPIQQTQVRVVDAGVEQPQRSQRKWRDPEIPISLVNIGAKYEDNLAGYVKHLNTYLTVLRAPGRNAVHEWWIQANRLCGACVEGLAWGAVRVGLCVEEVLYMGLKLQRPLAWPQGTELITMPSGK